MSSGNGSETVILARPSGNRLDACRSCSMKVRPFMPLWSSASRERTVAAWPRPRPADRRSATRTSTRRAPSPTQTIPLAKTLRQITAALNGRGIATARGGKWVAQAVARVGEVGGRTAHSCAADSNYRKIRGSWPLVCGQSAGSGDSGKGKRRDRVAHPWPKWHANKIESSPGFAGVAVTV